VKGGDEVDATDGRKSLRCAGGAETGPPRDSFSCVHAPARSEFVSRPHRLERLTEEDRSRSRAPDDPVAREDSLAEPVHHVGRTQAVERLAERVELEARSPRGRAGALTETKGLELLLTGLALAQMRFQRGQLGEPDVRLK
jgi:hypothetical protein